MAFLLTGCKEDVLENNAEINTCCANKGVYKYANKR